MITDSSSLTTQVWTTEDTSLGHIVEIDDGWKWQRPDGSWTKFLSDGRLSMVSFVDGGLMQLRYNGNAHLSSVIINGSKILAASASESQYVAALSFGASKNNLKFSYEDGRLLQVSTDFGSLVQFNYDELENLTRVDDSTGATLVQVTYDDHDRAIQYNNGSCLVAFKYLRQFENRLEIRRTEKCNGQDSRHTLFRLSFSKRKDLKKILDKAEVIGPEGQRHIHFDPYTGQPTQKYTKESPKAFKFDSDNRLTEVISASGAGVRLDYNGQERTPTLIHILGEGYLKLKWKGHAPQIIEIRPQSHSERLRQRLVETLETLAQARKDTSE